MRYKEIGEICSILSGYAFDSKQFTNDPQGFPLIRIRDIIRGRTDTYTKEKFNEKYIVKRGDLLIGMDGEFNIALWNSREALLNQRVCKIWSSSDEVINNYLYYFLPKALKDIEKRTSFVTVKHLSVKSINEIKIPLPPLAIQQQIASTLDTAAALLALRKQQLAELDALIQSVFIDMFGDLAINPKLWKVKKLIESCVKKDDIKCGPFGTQLSKEEYQNKGVPIWGIPQINKMFKINPTDYLTEEKAKQLEPYSIIADDIIMSRKGNVGKCAIYPNSFEMGIMHSDALRIRVDKSRVNPFFLMYQLHYSRYILNQIGIVSSGAIMAGINVTKLKNINIHVPSLALQNQFAVIVEKIEQQKALVQQAIDETQTLFDSLMAEYFE